MRTTRILFNVFTAAVFVATLFATPAPARAAGTTITVTSTIDNALLVSLNGNGTCDLREAAQAANLNAIVGECPAGSSTEPDTIAFNIPGSGVRLIALAAALTLSDEVHLDGTTQPGYAGSPIIRLDGNHLPGAGWGISVDNSPNSDHSTIKGLMLTGFIYGAISLTASHVTIQGNYIGTDGVSDLNSGSNSRGIFASSVHFTQIGGPAAGDRNVISGNATGVYLHKGTTNNVIENNYIGVTADGSAAIPGTDGIVIDSGALNTGNTGNLVRGNVISGQTTGIIFYGSANADNGIEGNFIGTNPAGTAAIPNQTGILIPAGSANVIGGSGDVPSGNLISGNGTGIQVSGTAAGTLILSNKIGTDLSGMSALPNTGYGIWLNGAPANIGDGVTPGENLVSGNGAAGIYLNGAGTSGTTILGNSIGVNANGSGTLPNGGSPNQGGIYITDEAAPQIAGNWIAGNENNGLFVYLSGTVAAGSTNNCFTGNVSYGASNTNSGVPLPLAGNWWGDATGPFHPVNNPSGLGDPVSDDVNASSFLTTPPAFCSPLLTPGSTSFNFGKRLVGTSAQKTLTLTNTGGVNLAFASITTTAPFSILGTGTCPVGGGSLAPGAACTVVVKFTPASAGLFTRNLTITSNAPTSPDVVTLTGAGVAGTELLKNPGFETDANLDNKPDAWGYTNFAPATDKRDCTIHKAGACSLKLAGNNQQKVARQIILRNGAAGDDFTFSLWSRSANVPAASIYRLQVQFFSGATLLTTKTMNFHIGTHAFEKVGGTFTAPGPYTKIVYRLLFKASSGTVWVDAASLRWAP